MVNFWVLQCVCVCLMLITVSGSVVLIGNNVTLSLEDIEANFAPSVKSSGKVGILYKAEPLNACSSLKNEIKEEEEEEIKEPFVLIIRGGGCSFEDKVRRAQSVGFKAVIIFDNQIGALVAMAGNSVGIKIPAIFVSKSSGETLMKYINNPKIEIWILQSFEDSAWSIMAISFILLLAMSAVLATCFFIKRHRIRRERPSRQITEYNNNNNGMSKRLLKAIPTLIFNIVQDDLNNTTSTTCAICLEDYNVGDKLRVLPCHHKFHAMCVDAWLTSWRTFCPVCKRDVRTTTGQPPPSEATPLLSSFSSTMTSSSVTSSLASSSSAIHINHHPTYSRSSSISNTPYNQLSYSISRSSMDLRNNNNNINGSSSQRSRGSFLVSSSPLNSSRYMLSPYIPSPGYNIGSSSSRQINALHISDSAASFSPFASAQSLPGVD